MSRFTAGLQAFFDELKRRHVFRVAAAYVVGGFFVLEAANLVFQGLLVPDWVYRAVTVLVLVGFPVVLVLSWLFQWTAHGIRLESAPEVEAGVAAAAAEPKGLSRPSGSPRGVRAFAFVGLGVVIALVGMGLSLPYMYAQRDGSERTLEGQREGALPVSDRNASARIAVLPFMSLTGGDDAGFADGLAEDVTAALAQLGGVDVVSRTTSEAYRDSDKTARTIGAELGVGLILEGTIRRAGDRVRVTVQLIDATTDRHLWAQSYDRDLTGDVFRTQSQLAQEIVAAIQSVVIPAEQDQAENRLLALGYSDRGSELLRRVEPAYDEAAQQLFEQALEVDSGNPVAHAGIAQTLVTRVQSGGPPALLDSAEAHAEHALRLNPSLPDAHAAHAFVLMVRGKMDSAQVSLRRAMELDESGEAFDYEWHERVRMISPEALDLVEDVMVEVGREFEFSVDGTDEEDPAPEAGRAPRRALSP